MTTNIKFTSRELQVLQRLVLGQSNAQIGLHLHIGLRTVESHVAHLLAKTGIAITNVIRT